MTLLSESRVSPAVARSRPTVSQYYFICNQKETQHLDMVKRVAEAGRLNITVEETYEGLGSVAAAFAKTMEGHTVGKVAIKIGR
mmetsp:Transcript_133145/g.323684  ORF Transcript_133145/g.323684 Transcript_133145/m.323684 type:complete len:84 (-) Transcript_133145:16-267(-)